MSVGHGAGAVFSAGIDSGVTLSSLVDLGHVWESVYLAVPTMTSGTDIFIQAGPNASAVSGYRVMHPTVNTSSAQAFTFVIGSATSQRIIPVPNGFRYMFIELSTAMTATSAQFKLYCSN